LFVSVINDITDTKEPNNIPVDYKPTITEIPELPRDFTIRLFHGHIYLPNHHSNTVSVINPLSYKKEHDIRVGLIPVRMAYDINTKMIYVANQGELLGDTNIPGTVSVIDGVTGKVAAGVIFNVNPANSGKIICNNVDAPTNTYLYVPVGTNCMVQHNEYYYYDGLAVSPLTNLKGASNIPLKSSGNLTVDRYGVFTVNFKPFPPERPPDYTFLFITVLVTTVIGWSIPSIAGWLKGRTQLKHLDECINQIGKLDRNAIEDKTNGYYVEGKISEAHLEFLKDRISEYYDSVKSSE
jgi:YVTN family beta-propeller protein